tara:strand:- start:857 stop:2023 length:1167 start_codon:yes stop_codon:yes gene_type:complete
MDNSPEAVKGRVRSLTKAIRYKARKEGNLMKAFNDYMSSQSGISATERSAIKSSLGLSENKWRTLKSDWRAEINEVVTGETNEKTIKEKKVKNKIVINPSMGMKEAIESLGGEIVEMVEEVEVDESMSPKEIQLQKRRSQIDMQIARDRRREVAKASTDKNKDAPTKAVGEGYGMGEIDQKVGAVTPIPKKEQDAAKARLLAKAKAKRDAKMKEDTKLSLDDFMGEAMRPGPRQRAMAAKQHQPYKKGGGTYSSRDKATAHNVAVRNDGPGTPGYEKKSTGGKGARYAGYGDQGAGNKARRRMGEKPLRGDTRKEEFASEEASDAMKDRRMERGGVDGNVDYKRAPGKPNTFGKKPSDPKAKQRAVDKVRDDIISRYGKGAIFTPKKK